MHRHSHMIKINTKHTCHNICCLFLAVRVCVLATARELKNLIFKINVKAILPFIDRSLRFSSSSLFHLRFQCLVHWYCSAWLLLLHCFWVIAVKSESYIQNPMHTIRSSFTLASNTLYENYIFFSESQAFESLAGKWSSLQSVSVLVRLSYRTSAVHKCDYVLWLENLSFYALIGWDRDIISAVQ